MRWLHAFSYSLLALATLIGAYVGAVAIGRAWLFWVLAPVAVLISSVYALLPRLSLAAKALTNYQATVRYAAQLKQERDELLSRLAWQEQQHGDALLAANEEGRRLVVGLVQSVMAGVEMEVLGAAVREGQLVVVAKPVSGAVPAVGAVYAISHSVVQTRQGLLRVIELAQDQKAVLMECIHEDVPEFWAALKKEAVVKQELAGLVLSIPPLDVLPGRVDA